MILTRRIGFVLGIAAITLAVAAPAQAEVRQVSGIVKAVDPAVGAVYFTDGRIVRLDPSAEIYVDGKKLTVRDIRAGNQVQIRQAAQPSAATPAGQQATTGHGQQQAVTLSEHPPVDAIGTIASIDQQAGIVTLQDGRMLKITEQTTFWQQRSKGEVQPGAQVFVDDAKPVAFRERGKAEMKADGSMRMGTVAMVDPQTKVIILTDGTRVQMGPTAVIRFNGQPVAVTELTPGSEIVVRVRPEQPQPAASPGMTDGQQTSLRPATGAYAEFQGDEILLLRKPQAP